VHHSDSYAATLVPSMIEMGIDIWQGVMDTNNIPELLEKYRGQIAFQGGINNAWLDNADWNIETIKEVVKRELDKYEPHGIIPSLTMGGPNTVYPEVYDLVSEEIRKYNKERFGV
ncbi:MAG: uroporphyrinogen decarboxylase, partial [Lachnospiraceae bacterium]|nr:uroporphyrinogen decarboxylase [Lachnospiraceae bacterium]